MTGIDQAVTTLFAHADELMAHGGGRVHVTSLHRLPDVRLLRSCREAATDDEIAAIRQHLFDLRSHLHGIEVATAPVQKSLIDRIKQGIAGGLGGMLAHGATREGREAEQWDQMTRAAGGSALLPPPKALIDAAEAWLVATVTEDRVDSSIAILLEPWETASVTPQN